MQGFAAGIMIAASFWSLLEPAIESSKGSSVPWLPAAIGFILGGFFIRALIMLFLIFIKMLKIKSTA